MAVGDIAANWGSDPHISPSRGELGPFSNTVLLGIIRVSLPNGISFRPVALAGCTSVTDDTHTYRDQITLPLNVPCVAVGGIALSDAA